MKIVMYPVRFYQNYISFLLKQLFGVDRMCKFTPSCSHYVLWMYQTHNVITATALSFKRILSCNPFTV